MHYAVEQLIALGFPRTSILQFDDPRSAAEQISQIVQAGDFILVKGSQGMRMEKIVEKIIADPSQAEKILCRQNKEWKKIPFMKP